MILGFIAIGVLTGLFAGTAALIAGYSILMALWIYTLSGCLVVASGLLIACTIAVFLHHHDADPVQGPAAHL